MCKAEKKRLVEHEIQLATLEAQGKISKVEHNLYKYNFSDGKSLGEWHNYFNDHIKKCKTEIKKEYFENPKPKQLATFAIVSSFFVLLLFSPPTVTGFFIYEQAEGVVNAFFLFIVKILSGMLVYMKARTLMVDLI